MKHATQYAKRLRRLTAAAKSPSRSDRKFTGEEITDLAVRASLMQFASDPAAAGAHRRMRSATVDLNDLRVTPIAELVEALGASFPQAQHAAEAVSRSLNAIFNRVHHLNLDFLSSMPKKEARAYLESLDGLTPFSSALVGLQALGLHAIPIDDRILQFLRDEEMVDPDAPPAEVQAFLERNIPVGKAEAVFLLLRQRAGSRPARKPSTPAKKPVPVVPASIAPSPAAATAAAGGKSAQRGTPAQSAKAQSAPAKAHAAPASHAAPTQSHAKAHPAPAKALAAPAKALAAPAKALAAPIKGHAAPAKTSAASAPKAQQATHPVPAAKAVHSTKPTHATKPAVKEPERSSDAPQRKPARPAHDAARPAAPRSGKARPPRGAKRPASRNATSRRR